MESQFPSEKQNLSSTQPMFHSNTNFNPESMPSAPPPSYTGPSQFAPPGMLCLQYYPSPAQGICYPQPYAPPPAGHPYYSQPGVAYPEPPPDTKYQNAMTQHQQQQQVVITSSMSPEATPVVADNEVKVSMVGAFVLSCVAYFFGGWVCGAMAFALACKSQFYPFIRIDMHIGWHGSRYVRVQSSSHSCAGHCVLHSQ